MMPFYNLMNQKKKKNPEIQNKQVYRVYFSETGIINCLMVQISNFQSEKEIQSWNLCTNNLAYIDQSIKWTIRCHRFHDTFLRFKEEKTNFFPDSK